MKRKSLLSLMLLCFAVFGVARAQVTIGDLETATNDSYLPMNSLYEYSYSQQIYTADEIGMSGTINSITVWMYGNENLYEMPFDIYMLEVDEESFETATSWIPVTSADIVYSGSVHVTNTTAEAFTFDLDTPFVYSGSGNLMIAFDNNTGSWKSGLNGKVFDAGDEVYRAIYARRDSDDYDPLNMSSISAYGRSAKRNVIEMDITASGDVCAKPTNLVVTYEGGTTATVTWEGTANAYNMEVNGIVTEGVTSPQILSGLDPATTYTVKVQADCGGGSLSAWASKSFFTDCDAYDVPFEYGFEDANQMNCWTIINSASSNSANIYNGLSYEDGNNCFRFSSYSSAATYDQYLISPELNCDGALAVSFQYVIYTASYPESFQVGYSTTTNDVDAFTWDDEVVASDETAWSTYYGNYPAGTKYVAIHYYSNYAYYLFVDDIIFSVDHGCRVPSDLEVTDITGRTATLNWTENGPATGWYILYVGENDEEVSEVYTETKPYVLEGLQPLTNYSCAVIPDCEDEMMSEVISFLTDEACPAPKVTVDAVPQSATVSWTGNADYSLQYCEAQNSTSASWLQYDNGSLETNIGNSSAGVWTYGAMYPASMIGRKSFLNGVSLYEVPDYITGETYLVNIYSGGDTVPETLIRQIVVTPMEEAGFHEILFYPMSIDATMNLWITVTIEGTYAIPSCENSSVNANNQWVLDGDEWANIGDLASSLAGYEWMIRGLIDSVDPATWPWITVTDVTSPYTINGLSPETGYFLNVMSDCGEDGTNSTFVVFTTPSPCDAPENLVAEPTANSAVLTWSDYQTSYNIKYRKAAEYVTLWEDDFENGMSNWTIYTEGETSGNDDGWYPFTPATSFENGFPAHSGDYTASSWSWSSTAFHANNYLVTPELELKGTLRFYACTNPGYPDSLAVYISTTGNTIEDFTVTLREMSVVEGCVNSGDWVAMEFDLSSYNGTPGYIALHHQSYDCNYLLIDDFGLYDVIAAEDWINTTSTENTLTITGLTPETDYEWQVQGVYANCDGGLTDWSELATFHTLELTTVTQSVALVAGTNYFSAFVEITLADLKDALVAALPGTAITIKGQQGTARILANGNMVGQLNATNFDPALLYQIVVPSDTEFILEGEPMDPAAHPINVPAKGSVWIAFPLSEPMTPGAAFEGFAVNGDIVKGQGGSSRCTNATNNTWVGQLRTLTPGQGYIYTSNKTEDRTLVFPSASKSRTVAVQSGFGVEKVKQANVKELELSPKQDRSLSPFEKLMLRKK